MDIARISRAIDYLTSRRKFYALLYVLGFLVLLPYASRGYSWHEMWDVIKDVLVRHAVIYRLVDMGWPSAVLHVLALALIAAVAVWGERAARAFDAYAFAALSLIHI